MITVKNLPKISIITPSYNHGMFIETAIRSVIEQNYPNLEYFVIDGGSTDGTQKIISEFSAKIDYWCSEKDGGQSDAIAKGFTRASGEILGWINSDDAYFPSTLNKIGHFFSRHPEVSLVTAGTVYTDKEGRITSCYERPSQRLWFAKHGITYFGQQAMFFRKQVYKDVGGIRRDFHFLMDTELLLRILLAGAKCGSLRGLCGFFRWHSDMKSIRREGRKADEKRIMEEEYGLINSSQKPFHLIYRIWQVINGNYALSLFETMRMKGKSISDIWLWD